MSENSSGIKWTLKEEADQVATTWADRLGVFLSALCLVHCILTPVALILLPTFQIMAIHEEIHHWLLLILPIVALTAFIPGYRRHRNSRVFVWALPGFMLLLSSHFLDNNIWASTFLSIFGSISLIRAHLMNRHLCACCAANPKSYRPNLVHVPRNRKVSQSPSIKSPKKPNAPKTPNN